MIAAAHPFDWHLHVVWLVALVALAVGYLWATRRSGQAATGRQKLLFLAGVILLAGALTWPLGDLASHWLLVARQALREDRDPLVAQQALVPLEGLAPGGVLGRIPGDLVRDGVESQRLARVEQHEHQIGDALQPVELRGGVHRPEPTASAGS